MSLVNGRKKVISKCLLCRKSYEQKRFWQKYCSISCQYKAYTINNPRIKKELLEKLTKEKL